MRLNRYFPLIVVMVVLFSINSCTKGDNYLEIKTSPSDKSLVHLASKTYEEYQLLEILSFNGSLSDFNAKYPIECLRKDNETYRVAYLGNECIAVILFDGLGNKLNGKIYSIQLLKSDFDRLIIGQPLDEVRKTDPNGDYLFLYTGRNDIPKVSTHYTKDGYLITIEYDASNIIVSINREYI